MTTTTRRRHGAPANTDERRIWQPSLEVRSLETESSPTGKLKRMRGKAVPYGERADIGWFLEEFVRGSFAKSITEAAAKLPLLLFHDDRAFPIGAAEVWEDERDGLFGEWSIDSDDRAQNAARLVKDEMLGGLSVRFSPIRTEMVRADDYAPELGPEHKDVFIRKEARLLEVSLVSTPAYASAGVQWVRTGERGMQPEASGREVDGWREYLERVRAGVV